MKRIWSTIKATALITGILMLSACGTEEIGENKTNQVTMVEEAESTEVDQSADEENSTESNSTNWDSSSFEEIEYLYRDWEEEAATYITLKDLEVDIDGKGASFDGSAITITGSGTYVLEGTLSDGQVIVASEDDVRLVLKGVDIYSSQSAPVYIKNAEETTITLADGTVNVLSDGDAYVYPDDSTDEPNSTVFSHDDLIIDGEGLLLVDACYNNGIMSKDDLIIASGNIAITSVDDGIIGKDSVQILSGNIEIEAGGDGIRSTNDTDETKGYIYIEDVDLDILAGGDGIQAYTAIMIDGGQYSIESLGDYGDDTASTKGLKAGADLLINGGGFNLDTVDDSLHSSGTITLSDGTFTITSGDDGIHADDELTILGGTININDSYEGLESAIINIQGGSIDITANDDGINVAGGNDGSGLKGGQGPDAFNDVGDYVINISGGKIQVDSGGDGLDSNGTINMTGGILVVHGTEDDRDSALDANGTIDISGGTIMAAGSSRMAMAPSDSSGQYSLSMTFDTIQAAGTDVVLKDDEGNVLLSLIPEKDYSNIVFSSPDIESGQVYYVNDTEFTASDVTTYLGAASGNMGGMRPGNGPKGDRPEGERPDRGDAEVFLTPVK